jgi:hypothetical protein
VDDLARVLLIRDPQIDAEVILAAVRKRLQQRQAEAAETAPASSRHSLDPEIYAALAEAQAAAEDTWVKVTVRDERLPLFNAAWNRFKLAIHEVIVLYVNSLAGRQTAFNVATTRLLAGLLQALEDRERRLQSLEAEVRELRAECHSLQAELCRRSGEA